MHMYVHVYLYLYIHSYMCTATKRHLNPREIRASKLMLGWCGYLVVTLFTLKITEVNRRKDFPG